MPLFIMTEEAYTLIEREANALFGILPGGVPWFHVPPERLQLVQQVTMTIAARELAYFNQDMLSNEISVDEIKTILGTTPEETRAALKTLREQRAAVPLDQELKIWRASLSGLFWALRDIREHLESETTDEASH